MPPTAGQRQRQSDPVIVNHVLREPEWKNKSRIDSRFRYKKLQNHVRWAGYDNIRISLEPEENLSNSRNVICALQTVYSQKPVETPKTSLSTMMISTNRSPRKRWQVASMHQGSSVYFRDLPSRDTQDACQIECLYAGTRACLWVVYHRVSLDLSIVYFGFFHAHMYACFM